MQVFGKLVSGGIALTLLYAASFKVASLSQLRTTLRSLGFSEPLAKLAAPGQVVFELIAGLALVGFLPQNVAGILVICFSVSLCGAGALALTRPTPIKCSCFSRYAETTLGKRQIVFAVPLSIVGFILIAGSDLSWTQQSALRLAAVCAAGVSLHFLFMASDIRELVGYRRAASSEYPA